MGRTARLRKDGKKQKLQAVDEDRGDELNVEVEEIHGVEGAESLAKERLTQKAVPELRSRVAEIALLLVKRGGQNEVENITQAVLGASFDARELRLHEKKVDDCKRLLENSRDENWL